MFFNPDKCEHIRIANKRKIIQTTYKISRRPPKLNLYLGVTFDKTLSWNSHIDMVTKRGNHADNLFSTSCPKDIKEARPQLQYAATVCDSVSNFDGNRGTKAILWNRELSILGEHENKPVYGNKGTGTPTPGRAP